MRKSHYPEFRPAVPRSLFRVALVLLAVAVQSTMLVSNFTAAVQAGDEAQKLRNDQEAVAGRYSRFERLLSQMADMLGREDPERAELLRRAISEGREQEISGELKTITELLESSNFGEARAQQGRVAKSMQQILTLLQSEDRRSEVEKERERLNELLKDIRNLTARQKAARAATQNSRSPSSSAPDQQRALKKTDEILDGVESHDKSKEEENNKDSAADENQSDSDSSDGKQTDAKGSSSEDSGEKNPKTDPTDETPKDGESKEGDSKKPKDSFDTKPKDGQPPSESENSPQDSPQESSQQSSQGQSGQSQNGDQKQQKKTPGRQELEEARQAMQEAIDQLKKQQRDGALKEQDDAISKLQEAQKKLEETLKQLREEEKEMILAALEARFQRMLSLQTQIYEETVAIGSTPRKEWLNNAITNCQKLSQQQSDLTRECSLTAGLLREDGTSVSILIAVEDIETDMKTVSGRLQQTKAFELTQSMQTDVIEALKELIETAQKEMEDMKQDQQQQQQQSGPQQKSALVELMAEIKVLRSLQVRVNRRTATVNRLLQQNDPGEVAELLNQVQELAVRQNRLTESAGELARQMEQKQ